MASSRSSSKTIRFNHPIEVRARPLPIKYFSSFRNLDVARLSKAKNAELELGMVKTSCCEQIVRATVRNGKVVNVSVEPCEPKNKKRAIPQSLKRVLDAAQKRIGRAGPGSLRLPVPLKTFVTATARGPITTITCTEICLFGYCIACCRTPSGQYLCGTLTIDTTTGPYPE